MAIGVFLGEQNCGKTLSMTYIGYDYFKHGYKVYSNYDLKFPHEKITLQQIMNYVTGKVQFNKCAFLLDEIYLLLDARNFGKNSNKIFSYFLLQTSKRQVMLLGTAQIFSTIEKRFRDNVKFQCFCERVYKVNDDFIEVDNVNRLLDNNDNLYIKQAYLIRKGGLFSNKWEVSCVYLKAKPVFKLFDTRKLLGLE